MSIQIKKEFISCEKSNELIRHISNAILYWIPLNQIHDEFINDCGNDEYTFFLLYHAAKVVDRQDWSGYVLNNNHH